VVFVRAELEKFLDELPGYTLNEVRLENVSERTTGTSDQERLSDALDHVGTR